MSDDLRCTVASAAAGEPLAGSAPTDRDWLVVEHPGPWGPKAVTGSRLPEAVVRHLSAHPGRVQLVRRPSGVEADGGVRVYAAVQRADGSGGYDVRTALLERVEDLPGLDDADLAPHPGPLWLVCTNGRRDVCCAEVGRPVAAALARTDPVGTWETTHLGGHRFAGTLLALPSGVALGRLDAASAGEAVGELVAGRVPLHHARGRAGWPPVAQVADLHLRHERGWDALDDVGLVGVDGERVTLSTPAGGLAVTTGSTPGPSLLHSCADAQAKPTRRIDVVSVEEVSVALPASDGGDR